MHIKRRDSWGRQRRSTDGGTLGYRGRVRLDFTKTKTDDRGGATRDASFSRDAVVSLTLMLLAALAFLPASPQTLALALAQAQLQRAASLLGLLEHGLQPGDVVLVRLAGVLQSLLVRLVSALELGDLSLEGVVLDLEARERAELLVPLVLDPGVGPLAATGVVDLVDAAEHGELLVDLVRG